MPTVIEKQTKIELTIQEMAKQSGLSEHTLRYYERIGLLTPIPRHDSSGHRRYSEETVRLVESLSCLRGTGMSIEDMRRFLKLRERGRDAASDQKALFAAHEAELRNEMERLQRRINYIAGKVAYWDAVESGDLEKAAEVGAANQILAKTLATKKETK